MISDVLFDAVKSLNHYLDDPFYQDMYDPEILTEARKLCSTMDQLRARLDDQFRVTLDTSPMTEQAERIKIEYRSDGLMNEAYFFRDRAEAEWFFAVDRDKSLKRDSWGRGYSRHEVCREADFMAAMNSLRAAGFHGAPIIG
jgi:hypothetical protein